jgi:hypothetical protein
MDLVQPTHNQGSGSKRNVSNFRFWPKAALTWCCVLSSLNDPKENFDMISISLDCSSLFVQRSVLVGFDFNEAGKIDIVVSLV